MLELVNEASLIVIVEAISSSATPENACQFRVVLTLKGNDPEQIPVLCRLPGAGDWMTHFSGHSEPHSGSSVVAILV